MRFGRYEIERRLAEGGMAEVFLARADGPAGFEKRVVLKLVLPHRAQDRHFTAMFLDEARLVARLDHPNIAQVFELGQEGGRYFLAMEYVDGEALSEIIDAANDLALHLPLHYAARIVSRVCAGLDHAHHLADEQGTPLGLVHRDISPDNVLVSLSGAVKVIDFGIAKAASNVRRTEQGGPKGKHCYMSPEQIRGKPLDGRSDVFAVGILLYELITGERPFGAGQSLDAVGAILHDDPAPPSAKRSQVPQELDAIVLRALDKDLAARYPRAGDMQRDLERFIQTHADVVGDEQLAELVALVRRGEAQDAVLIKRREREVSVVPVAPQAALASGSAPTLLPGLPSQGQAAPRGFRRVEASRASLWRWLGGGALLGGVGLAIFMAALPGRRTAGPAGSAAPQAEVPDAEEAPPDEDDALAEDALPSGPLVIRAPFRHLEGPPRTGLTPKIRLLPDEPPPEVPDASEAGRPVQFDADLAADGGGEVALGEPAPPLKPSSMRWPGRITVTANLAGAEVWAGGKLGVTPLRGAMLYQGSYDLEVRAGSVVWTRRVTLGGEPLAVHAELAAGRLEVSGVPDGTRCLVQGHLVAPAGFVAPGRAEVRCTRGQAAVWSAVVQVARGATARLTYAGPPGDSP